MTRIGRWASVAAFAAVAGATVLAADAGADIVRTRISLADFKAAYNLSSVRRLFDNGNGQGTSLYIQRFDQNGVPISQSGGKADLSKSFVFFRVDTARQIDPVSGAFTVRVQFGPFAANKPPVILTCTMGGDTASGVRSLQCGSGPSISPS
jgi:hypothetical protein